MPAFHRRLASVATAVAVLGLGAVASPMVQQPVTTPSLTTSLQATAFAAKKPSVSKAAKYVATHKPKKWTSASTALTVGLGLTVAKCTQAKTLKSVRTYLKAKASSYAGSNAYAAAKLAIFVKAVGDNPRSFGGVDLAHVVLNSTLSTGQIGTSSTFSWGQALGMIGLGRAGVTPNQAMVNFLLSQQHSTGSWGWSSASSSADPDFTAVALMALSSKTIGATLASQSAVVSAVAKAKSWAAANQQKTGYWKNYSPVDSTSLLGSALNLQGVSTSKALAWMAKVQLKNGGFANTLKGKKANLMATAEALFLAGGKSFVTVSAPLNKCS